MTYTDIAPDANNLYTSHIKITPCEAGYRYTAPVSDLAPTIWLGSGTESTPYQITTAAQLRLLSTNVNNGTSYVGEYFEMTNDIDLGGIDDDGKGVAESEFTAIGYIYTSASFDASFYNNTFQGTFDGGGHKVSGLYINQPSSYYQQAIFGYAYNATIINLGVSGSVTGYDYVGGIVGCSYGSVSNCCFSGSVTGNQNVGGIVGRCDSEASVSNSIYDSSVYTGDAVGKSGSNVTSGIIENVVGSETLKATMTNGSFSATLGTDSWKEDYTTQINDGYPVLSWQ